MRVAELVERIYAWEPVGQVKLLHRCDVCKVRRLVGRYHEVYYTYSVPGSHQGWQWACTRCLLAVVGDIAEKYMQESKTTEPRPLESAILQPSGSRIEHVDPTTLENRELTQQLRNDPLVVASIRRGLKDVKEGNVQPWEDIKRELGL